jgi:hypothetical protein
VALQLRMIQSRIDTDPALAKQLVTSASEELSKSLEELRELARGIHPSVLNHGLKAALDSLASRSGVPTTVSFEPRSACPSRWSSLPTSSPARRWPTSHDMPRRPRRRCGSRAATGWRSSRSRTTASAAPRVGRQRAPGPGRPGRRARRHAAHPQPPGAGTVVTAELPCAS